MPRAVGMFLSSSGLAVDRRWVPVAHATGRCPAALRAKLYLEIISP